MVRLEVHIAVIMVTATLDTKCSIAHMIDALRGYAYSACYESCLISILKSSGHGIIRTLYECFCHMSILPDQCFKPS